LGLKARFRLLAVLLRLPLRLLRLLRLVLVPLPDLRLDLHTLANNERHQSNSVWQIGVGGGQHSMLHPHTEVRRAAAKHSDRVRAWHL
jgi:hypothetical protein